MWSVWALRDPDSDAQDLWMPQKLQLKLASLKNVGIDADWLELATYFCTLSKFQVWIFFQTLPSHRQEPCGGTPWELYVRPSVTDWSTYHQRSIVSLTGRVTWHLLKKYCPHDGPRNTTALCIYSLSPFIERTCIFLLFNYLSPPISIFSRMENREKPDSESGSVRGEGGLVRQLKNRHVAMIRYASQFHPTLVNNHWRLCFSVLEVPSAQVSPSN